MTTAALQIQMIALEQLDASARNPRRTMIEADLQELAASIREHGIQVPLLVRPDVAADNDNESRFEIVAGHRRSEAATLAGLTEVPCLVRVLSDEEAAEIALIDNLQRVDVPAMEEAEAFGELLTRLGSVQAVAAKVGKEQGYVAKRLKLSTCTESTRRAVNERLITVDHALLLARLSADEQDAALTWALNQPHVKSVDDALEEAEESRDIGWSRWEPESVAALKSHIESEAGTPLARAPWPMEEDYLLPDVGSCLDCEKNTSANAPLFGDLAIAEPKCTDGACFKAKVAALVQLRISDATCEQQARDAGPAIRLSWKTATKKPRVAGAKAGDLHADGFNAYQAFGYGQWLEAKPKSCAFMRLGVTVDWKRDASKYNYSTGDADHNPGEILTVCVAESCTVHKKAYAQAEKKSAASSPRESQEDSEERSKEFKLTETSLRRALYDAILAKLSGVALRRAVLRAQDEVYGVAEGLGIRDERSWEKTKKAVHAAIDAADEADLDRLMFHAAFSGELNPGYYDYQEKDKGRGELRALAKVAGVDAAAIERQFDKPAKAKKVKPEAKAADVAEDEDEEQPRRRVLSPAARKRVAEAQQKRWKAVQAGAKKPAGGK